MGIFHGGDMHIVRTEMVYETASAAGCFTIHILDPGCDAEGLNAARCLDVEG